MRDVFCLLYAQMSFSVPVLGSSMLIDDVTKQQFERLMGLNVVGPFLVSKVS